MRQNKLEIKNEAVIDDILNNARIGRLGTNGKDGFPYITPVNFVYWNETIYFHSSMQGEKLENFKRDPRVCFEIDLPLAYLDTQFDRTASTCSVTQFYQCIIIRGMAELIDDIKKKVQILNMLMARHENDTQFKKITPETKAVSVTSVVAIRIKSLTAKANLAQKKSAADKEKICEYLTTRAKPGDNESADLIRST